MKKLSHKLYTKAEGSPKNRQRKASQYSILVVDDNPDITYTLKIGLEKNRFAKVDAFNDPILALSSFRPGSYDLLLIDVKMAKMNGFELYQEFRKKDRKVKTCFITAYEVYYETLKQEFPSLNVGCFISKPIEIDSLVRRIKLELASDIRS